MGLTQYSVVLVGLDPTIGSEIKKTRPCVVLSPNVLNINLKTVVIAPLTSSRKKYPTRVPVTFQEKEGFIAIDQIRTIDQSRILKVFDPISAKSIKRVKAIVQETFVA